VIVNKVHPEKLEKVEEIIKQHVYIDAVVETISRREE